MLFSLTVGFAQYNPIQFEKFTIKDGLPDNTINAIMQDSRDFCDWH